MIDPHKIDDGYEKFIKAASTNLDPTLMLLKFHLLSEYYLEQIINHFLRRGDVITSQKNFTYNHKLMIVKSFDIIPGNIVACLEKLNAVRNKCSHEINYTVTESDVDFIGNPLNTIYFKLKREHQNLKELLHWLFGRIDVSLEVQLEKIDKNSNLIPPPSPGDEKEKTQQEQKGQPSPTTPNTH